MEPAQLFPWLASEQGLLFAGAVYWDALVRFLVPATAVHLLVGFLYPAQRRKVRAMEVRNSLLACLILGTISLLSAILAALGYTRHYQDIASHGIPYFLATVAILLLWFDFHFYAVHRTLHIIGLKESTHLAHHRPRPTTAFSALAFSWQETTALFGIFLVIPFVMPVHFEAVSAFYYIAITHSALIHAGVEFCPKWWLRAPGLNLVATISHHELHHREPDHNFGLYFVWWDRLLGTENPANAQFFHRLARREA